MPDCRAQMHPPHSRLPSKALSAAGNFGVPFVDMTREAFPPKCPSSHPPPFLKTQIKRAVKPRAQAAVQIEAYQEPEVAFCRKFGKQTASIWGWTWSLPWQHSHEHENICYIQRIDRKQYEGGSISDVRKGINDQSEKDHRSLCLQAEQHSSGKGQNEDICLSFTSHGSSLKSEPGKFLTLLPMCCLWKAANCL